MTGIRNFLYLAISIPVIIILIWYVALPDSFIKTAIEDSISHKKKTGISASIKGFKKGLFFTVHADSLDLSIDRAAALSITNISTRINPLSLLKKQIAFSMKGKIGTGDIKGVFKLPDSGSLTVERVEFNAIPYLASIGFEGSGLISAKLNLKNNVIDVTFEIPDAEIHGSIKGMPLPINSFHKIQGALFLRENTIQIKSIGLEGERGYARLKGRITNGIMNLALELMPSAGELNSIESMLVGKYRISPGYYVIPIRGPLL